MQRTKNYNGEVHPKVEYPENLRVCKGKNWYTNYFGQCDSTEDLLQKELIVFIYYVIFDTQLSKYIH